MITEKIFYGLMCDRCREDYDGDEYSYMSDKGAAGLHRQRKHVAVPHQRAEHPQGDGPDAVCRHSPLGYAWQC